MPTVREIVQDELNKQKPNFLESLGHQLIIQSHISNAVHLQLPKALQQNSGLISQHVQTHMPSVLNQQHYFLSGIAEQKKRFEEMSHKQLQEYKNAENNMISRLNHKVNSIVSQTIKNVSNKDTVIHQMRENIKKDVVAEVNQNINSRINTACTVTGIVSAGVGCLASYLIQSHL
jgi:hypothetical protein